VLGDVESGYVLTPVDEEMARRIDAQTTARK
jgi:predicted RNase H-like nuclease